MRSKVKKTRFKEANESPDTLTEEKQKENEKENKSPEIGPKRRRNVRNIKRIQFEETETEESSKSFSKGDAEFKPLGFWSKKLKDLEESRKDKKCGLYEFSGTDESESSYKKKKKPRPKGRIKKRQPIIPTHCKLIKKNAKTPKPGAKSKQAHMQSFCREQIILSKERKKLADKGEKFTFSTGMPSLGITSTPAVKKDNLVGASNFLFLSPIIKEEVECGKNVESPLAEPVVNDRYQSTINLDQETPKVETKLKRISCRRVLRSGKMLNT